MTCHYPVHLSLLGFFLWLLINPAEAEEGWYLTAYRAEMSGDKLFETLTFQADYESAYHFVALAVGKHVGAYSKHIDFEVEGQFAKHTGAQRYEEYNAVFVVRWQTFPWDKFIETSLAIGEGISYTSEVSDLEATAHKKASKFLNYLLFELSFAHPEIPQWNYITRVHHRSGIYGIFNGVRGASNAWGVGIRYTF